MSKLCHSFIVQLSECDRTKPKLIQNLEASHAFIHLTKYIVCNLLRQPQSNVYAIYEFFILVVILHQWTFAIDMDSRFFSNGFIDIPCEANVIKKKFGSVGFEFRV